MTAGRGVELRRRFAASSMASAGSETRRLRFCLVGAPWLVLFWGLAALSVAGLVSTGKTD